MRRGTPRGNDSQQIKRARGVGNGGQVSYRPTLRGGWQQGLFVNGYQAEISHEGS